MNETQHDIFLSYARRAKKRARPIFEALGRQGWSVFMDEDIRNAERWEQILKQQLETVSCVLVLWTDAARKSEWVNKEARRGHERERLVHATLDGEIPPEEFSALKANNLSEWDGIGFDEEFLRVMEAVAEHIGTKGSLGTLPEPKRYEKITGDHLALTSTSWKRERGDDLYPYQIQLRLVGTEAAMRRVENVVYYFDPAYAQNRPDNVDPVLKAYVKASAEWRTGFGVYELANGYSVVRASVKVTNQPSIVNLSRIVDIMEKGPWLKKLYPTWPKEND